ncbi:MAG: tetratricopeptide repeat protein [Myxococcales bacterium]
MALGLALFWMVIGGGNRWAGLIPVGGRPAFADSASQRTARQHFHQGEAYYTAGKYPEALAEYQAGYDVAPLPGFLVNIAQCQRRMGDLHRARASYGKFVLVAPDSPLAPEVRGLIEELDRLIAETATAARTPSGGDGAAPPRPAAISGRRLAMSFDGNGVLPFSSADDPAERGATTTAPGADLREAALVTAPGDGVVNESEGTTAGGSSHHWWLWSSLVAVAAGAVTLAVILSAPEANTVHEGSLGTLRR